MPQNMQRKRLNVQLEPRVIDMEVRNVRVAGESPSPSGFARIAVFDLRLTSDLALLNLRLVRSPTGTLQVYPAEAADGTKSASFAPALRERIARLVATEMEPSLARTRQPS